MKHLVFIALVATVALSFAVVARADASAPTAPPAAAASPAAAPIPPPPPHDAAEPTEERAAENAVYLEALGPAVFYSVNYDRAFGDVAGRVGIGFLSVGAAGANGSASASWLSIPLTASYLGIGSKTHIFEVGGGLVFHYFSAGVDTLGAKSSGSALVPAATLIAGYRYQPPKGGFFLRAGLSPLIFFGSVVAFLPWPHVGVGGTF